LILAERKEVDINIELAGKGWVLEPDAGELAVRMKSLIDNYSEAQEKSKEAAQFIKDNFTWEKAAEKAQERFDSVPEEKSTKVKKEKVTEMKSKLDLEKVLGDAREAFEIGNLENAEKLYAELYKRQPEDSEILLGYGSVLFSMGKLEDAEKIFKEGVNLHSGNPEFYNNMGCVQFQMGNHESAGKNFEKSVELDKTSLNARKNLANHYLQTGSYTKVIPVCEDILKDYPEEVETMVILGNCCFQLNMIEESVSLFQKALSIAPDFEDARANLEVAQKRLKGE